MKEKDMLSNFLFGFINESRGLSMQSGHGPWRMRIVITLR